MRERGASYKANSQINEVGYGGWEAIEEDVNQWRWSEEMGNWEVNDLGKGGQGIRGCWNCGDPSHLKAACPHPIKFKGKGKGEVGEVKGKGKGEAGEVPVKGGYKGFHKGWQEGKSGGKGDSKGKGKYWNFNPGPPGSG